MQSLARNFQVWLRSIVQRLNGGQKYCYPCQLDDEQNVVLIRVKIRLLDYCIK